MPGTPNYTEIATRFPNPRDGQIELERVVGGVPTADQSANLTRAYVNLEAARAGGGGGGSPRTMSFSGMLESQMGASRIADIGPSDSIDAFKMLNPFIDGLEKKRMVQSEILNQVKRESDLYTELSEKTGLQGDLLKNQANAIGESSVNALKFGYNINQVTSFVTKMGEGSGRFNLISKETLDRSYATGRAFVGDLSQLADAMTQFEKVGIGAKNTLDAIDKAGRASMSLGLNSKKTTETLRQEIGKLNEYGFANGVEGLNRMVQRSLEFRMNMGEVFKIADKVMDPAGAIEMTANMQMLGGAIGDLNDPLKLMYMATNNVEGLQDAMMGAVQNLATYNEEQQRFEVTGINLRRVREMATAMGVDYKELTKGAIAAQERMLATNALMGKGLDISEADREFIVNMAQMKDGRMSLTLPPDIAKTIGASTEVALEDLSSEQIEKLKGFQDQLVKMNVEDIAQGQFTSVKNVENMLKSMMQMQLRGLAIETMGKTGASANLGEVMKNLGITGNLDEMTQRQERGAQTKLGGVVDIAVDLAESAIKAVNIPDLMNKTFKAINDALESATKGRETKEGEDAKKRREEQEKKSEPTTLIHKHEFKILSPFASSPLDYVGSYTTPVGGSGNA